MQGDSGYAMHSSKTSYTGSVLEHTPVSDWGSKDVFVTRCVHVGKDFHASGMCVCMSQRWALSTWVLACQVNANEKVGVADSRLTTKRRMSYSL